MCDVPTSDYADGFIGGRGIAAKIYWDEVPPEAKAFDPENMIMFVTGPIESETLNTELLVSGKDGKPIYRKGTVVDREKFAKMLGESPGAVIMTWAVHSFRGQHVVTGCLP